VYELFKVAGLSENRLMVEGFGEYRPKVSNNTPLGRTANRRVDIVLDKRENQDNLPQNILSEPEERNPYKYEQGGFVFDLTPLPPATEE
jgi:chemotaxis protein MotB